MSTSMIAPDQKSAFMVPNERAVLMIEDAKS